jgi:hypothetical protein
MRLWAQSFFLWNFEFSLQTYRYNIVIWLPCFFPGMDDLEEAKPLEEMLNDTRRVHFYQDYLTSVLAAIRYFSYIKQDLPLVIGGSSRFSKSVASDVIVSHWVVSLLMVENNLAVNMCSFLHSEHNK